MVEVKEGASTVAKDQYDGTSGRIVKVTYAGGSRFPIAECPLPIADCRAPNAECRWPSGGRNGDAPMKQPRARDLQPPAAGN